MTKIENSMYRLRLSRGPRGDETTGRLVAVATIYWAENENRVVTKV
jgi:hypothetical protein